MQPSSEHETAQLYSIGCIYRYFILLCAVTSCGVDIPQLFIFATVEGHLDHFQCREDCE